MEITSYQTGPTSATKTQTEHVEKKHKIIIIICAFRPCIHTVGFALVEEIVFYKHNRY